MTKWSYDCGCAVAKYSIEYQHLINPKLFSHNNHPPKSSLKTKQLKMPSSTAIPAQQQTTSSTNGVTDSAIPGNAPSLPTTGQTPQAMTEAEQEADRLYEERIEEEYAKREGGA